MLSNILRIPGTLLDYINKVRKQTTGNGNLRKLANPSNFLFPSATFLTAFLLAFIAGSLIIHPKLSQATTGLGLVGAQTMTLSSSTSNLQLALSPTPASNLASGQHNLTAATNIPTGYNLILAVTNGSALPPTTGTLAAPTALANNTWGYAVPKVANSTQNNTILNGFDASYATPTPSTTSKWANPTTNTTIKHTTVSTTQDNTAIYYGAKVDHNLPAGTYQNTVRYTATVNAATVPPPVITSVTPNSGTTAGGTTIEIIGTGFTVNNESITTTVTVDSQSCTDVSISSNTPITGQDTIYCTTPAHAAGAVSIQTATWGGTTTATDAYTYVTPANLTFVSPSLASTVPGTESGPAITIAGTNFTTGGNVTGVTIGGTACASYQVISDTQIFCKAPNTITATGDKAIAINKTVGTGTIANTGTMNITYSDASYPTLQGSDAFAQCDTTAKLFRDTRDSQLYYVKKIVDGKCWMVDNLKYANYGDLREMGKMLTVSGTDTKTAANTDVAMFADSGASDYCTGNVDMPANTNTRCGLFYNWYTATKGTGTYARAGTGTTTNVAGSICPANFRLPSTASNGNTPTSNGSSYAAADFPVLNASMNAGAPSVGNLVDLAGLSGLQPSGLWGGIYSSAWWNAPDAGGRIGYFWSSTTNASVAGSAHATLIWADGLNPGGLSLTSFGGFAVRCVMDQPQPIDVYPTTGWTSDTITITGQGFTNITNVIIGGTPCQTYQLHSSSKLTCVLPAKAHSSSNNVEVISNGNNITPTSTYTHMKVTYFDPNQNTVTMAGTTYPFYANGFTSANCTNMTPNNNPIAETPATSLAYVRDTRNNQTYKVKRMVDYKCWMVDNLKYISTTSPSNIDGTVGITFNNIDAATLAPYGTSSNTVIYNSVDGTNTQSTANSDKAFYNNPMGSPSCYGGSTNYMSANTLTHCGYTYSWYAATNGAGTYNATATRTNVTGSICPANFRLPSTVSDGGSSIRLADYPVLHASIDMGALNSGDNRYAYSEWLPVGAWGGTFTRAYTDGTNGITGVAYLWSSTPYRSSSSGVASVIANTIWNIGANPAASLIPIHYPGLSSIRCVMDAPIPSIPIPPRGTNPTNIASTNPATIDVYPTASRSGDTIAITSNALFTNITNVTIGGTACVKWGVVNPSLISCILPWKDYGTTHAVAVISNGTNITPASVYTHMKITFFNPVASTVSVGGINYKFYPNGMTSEDCATLTPNNDPIASTPAASLAYVRDTRNNQVYRVKRMADYKCWMVDNLKYINTTIRNTADNTKGMTYNNGDHLTNGGTTAHNTIDESNTRSAANVDKAFYNNPMSKPECYGGSTTYMSANTLTHCGYLYNWYAATAGTGTYQIQGTPGTNVTENICPLNFRLPSSTSGEGSATSNGTESGSADFPVLNASMIIGGPGTGHTNTDPSTIYGWQPAGAWGSTLSGYWRENSFSQGTNGLFWTSTVYHQYQLTSGLNLSDTSAYTNYSTPEHIGQAIRCVLPAD